MFQMLIKPLLGVAGEAVKGYVSTKKAKAELAVTEIKAKQKQQFLLKGKILQEEQY